MSTYRGDEVPIADQVEEDLRLRGPSVIESGQHDRPDPDTLNSPEPGSDRVPAPGQKGFNKEGEVRAGDDSPRGQEAASRQQHLNSATRELGLSDQEKFLYEHHLDNLHAGLGYHHQDGSISTVLGTTVGIGDRTYMIPRVHERAIVPVGEAVDIARMRGLSNYPSYDSPEQARARYDKMHEYMDRDVRDHIDLMLGQLEKDRQREGGPDRVITEPHSGGTRTRNLDEEQRRQLNDQLNYNDRQGLINRE